MTIEIIAGSEEGAAFSRCFDSLGAGLSPAAYSKSELGTFYLAAVHPGFVLLEVNVPQRTVDPVFRSEHFRNAWGIDMMESDDEILVVMPAGVSLINLDGDETWVGPEVLHPGKYFHHTAWATTSQGYLLNVDDGLRLYSQGEETVLVTGRFDRSGDAAASVLGIADLGCSWIVLERRTWEDPEGDIVYSFIVQVWDAGSMQPGASFAMPPGVYWNLSAIGQNAVLWSHEGSRIFVITRSLDYYSLEVPVKVSRTADRVFGNSSDRFYYVNENGYADVKLEGIGN